MEQGEIIEVNWEGVHPCLIKGEVKREFGEWRGRGASLWGQRGAAGGSGGWRGAEGAHYAPPHANYGQIPLFEKSTPALMYVPSAASTPLVSLLFVPQKRSKISLAPFCRRTSAPWLYPHEMFNPNLNWMLIVGSFFIRRFMRPITRTAWVLCVSSSALLFDIVLSMTSNLRSPLIALRLEIKMFTHPNHTIQSIPI